MHNSDAKPTVEDQPFAGPSQSTFPAQVALWLAIFIDSAGYSLIIPLLEPLLLTPASQVFLLGSPYEVRSITLGLLLGAYPFMVLFMAPVLGNLSDRVGRKKVLLVCLGGLLLGNLMIGLAIVSGCVWLAFLGRLVAGATAGCQPVAQAAMVDLGRPETKATRLSMCLLGTSLGLAVGPVLAGFLSDSQLVSWFSYATPVFVLAVAALGTLILLGLVLHQQEGSALPLSWKTLGLTDSLGSFAEVARDSVLRTPVLLLLVMQVACAAYYTFALVFLAKGLKYSTKDVGTFMAIFGIGNSLAFAFILPPLMKVLSLKNLVTAGLALTTLVIPLTLSLGLPSEEYVLALLSGITISIAFGAFVALMSNLVSADRQGWILGITGSTVSLGYVVAALVSGVLTGFAPADPVIMATVLMGISAVGLFLYRPSFKVDGTAPAGATAEVAVAEAKAAE